MNWQHILTATWRTVFVFLFALFMTRILNKQFVARMTYFDFTLGVTVGALIAHVANDYKEPFWPVVVPLLVITVLGVLVGWVALRFPKVRHVIDGEPTVLIQNGKILEDNMRRLRYNQDQLNSQLRASGIYDISHVEFAVLEPGGHLSVLPKSQHRPLSPADLQVATRYEGMAIEVIMDGKVVHKNLRENGLDEEWLHQRLLERGIFGTGDVYYAVLNSRGQLFIDLYRDQIHRPVDLEGLHPSTPPTPDIP